MCHTKTPIDLAAAHRIARGKSQKRWLAEMVAPAGLNPHIGEDRASYRRIAVFADKLALAGYATQVQLLLVPGFYFRIVITGYVPAAAPLLAAIRANTGTLMSPGCQTVSQGDLLAWVEHAAPEVVDAAAAIAPSFTGSLADLLAVAPGIALAPGRHQVTRQVIEVHRALVGGDELRILQRRDDAGPHAHRNRDRCPVAGIEVGKLRLAHGGEPVDERALGAPW